MGRELLGRRVGLGRPRNTANSKGAGRPRGTTRWRWKRTSYFAVPSTPGYAVRLKNKRVWGCSKAVEEEVSARAFGRTRSRPDAPCRRARFPGSSSPCPIGHRHAVALSRFDVRCLVRPRATRALYSWLLRSDTDSDSRTDTLRAARAGSAHGSATHSVASCSSSPIVVRVALTRAWTRRRGACLRLSPARCRRASRALRWS